MKLQVMTFVVLSSVLLVATPAASAKTVKYKGEQIGAKETCKDKDPAMPVQKCIKKFAETFCKDKGHKSYIAANWETTKGYANPTSIYCK